MVVGGGLAGTSAACVLAERGVSVTVVEAEPFLGGRLAAWPDTLSSGETFRMERGFHAFFRHYYNLRSLLRRIDPGLELLRPVADYPILGPNGARQSFASLPTRPPANIVELVRRTPAFTPTALFRVNGRAAARMLAYEEASFVERFDALPASDYLDSLRFPAAARRMLFDVFAHSFFNPEESMSAAELLLMFHFYFMGNPEGLVFDVLTKPFSRAVWEPLRRRLEGTGVQFVLGHPVTRIEPRGQASLDHGRTGWRVSVGDGRAPGRESALDADLVVLAIPVAALRAIVASSPRLDDRGWRRAIDCLCPTLPFAVYRLWLDRPTASGRHPFVGTTGIGPLDNISLFHLIEDESAAWAERHGGSVVELHAYAVPEPVDEDAIRRELLDGLHAVYPETRPATLIEERFLLRADCPAFPPGSTAIRPGTGTPWPGLALAGDFTRLPFPSALMERAVASGFLAANQLLAPWSVRPEPLWSVPRRGVLAGLPL